MRIPLCIVEPYPEVEEPGMMWRDPTADVPGRENWYIVLPEGYWWHTTAGGWKSGEKPCGWEVSGIPPNITVTPSIFCDPPNGWHGWITNGEIV